MSDVRVLNGGSLVSRRIEIDRYSTTAEDLIEAIREACTDLENARFETVVEDGPHSAYEMYSLEVYGTPTGELARQAKIVAEARR